MTGYCALPSHFSQATLTPNHILKTAFLTGSCSPWVLLHYFARLSTMLWTPDCPRIACWRAAVPLAQVEGGFNCVGMSIGHAYTKAHCSKYQNRNTKQSLHHSPDRSAAPPINNFSPFASHLPVSTPDQPILPLSTSSQPPSPRKKPSILFNPL